MRNGKARGRHGETDTRNAERSSQNEDLPSVNKCLNEIDRTNIFKREIILKIVKKPTSIYGNKTDIFVCLLNKRLQRF